MPKPISLTAAFAALEFHGDRRPGQDGAALEGIPKWFDTVAAYRDGGVFIVHYAGSSEWERHRVGDEVVMCLEGATTMTLLLDEGPTEVDLGPMEMVIVPKGVWHRFDTPDAVKVMTITPQPTDHSVDDPPAG